ncbi:hypothetical protein D3C87_1676790 [compost metagenome]
MSPALVKISAGKAPVEKGKGTLTNISVTFLEKYSAVNCKSLFRKPSSNAIFELLVFSHFTFGSRAATTVVPGASSLLKS